eukprot:1357687-Pyramimonas_sp.AAC.1
MQGRTSGDTSTPDDRPKRAILLEQLREGNIDILCICGTKLEKKHIQDVLDLIRKHDLAHRTSW